MRISFNLYLHAGGSGGCSVPMASALNKVSPAQTLPLYYARLYAMRFADSCSCTEESCSSRRASIAVSFVGAARESQCPAKEQKKYVRSPFCRCLPPQILTV